MPRLRVATFNVNGIRSRLPHLLQWLERERPDVACLQELKATDEAFPVADIERVGYGALWHGQRSWNGVAILARDAVPLESRRGLPGDPSDAQSRYLEAAAHGVIVGCLYLPNGNPQPGPKFDYKLAWFERLMRHARGLHDSGHPVVLAGDYNVVPTDELDIYDPTSWRRDALLQPESRECWTRLLDQGWTDAIRVLHPGEKVFTFWDYFRQHWPRNAGLRIDHLLLNPPLAPRLRAAGVDRWVRGLEGASDHAPAWVELETGAGRARRPADAGKQVRKPTGGRGTAKAPGKRVADAKAEKPADASKATGKAAAGKAVRGKAAAKTAAAKQAVSRRAAPGKAAPRTAVAKKAAKQAGRRAAPRRGAASRNRP